jgi:hypothetical protein
MMIASTGQMPEQLGQAMHLSSNTLAFAFFLGTTIASVGHTFWHAPQLMHKFLITWANSLISTMALSPHRQIRYPEGGEERPDQ